MEDYTNPSHYTALKPEPIEVIEGWGLDFRLANALKYISRQGRKTPDGRADLKKAIWYIQRFIDKEYPKA